MSPWPVDTRLQLDVVSVAEIVRSKTAVSPAKDLPSISAARWVARQRRAEDAASGGGNGVEQK